jgi:hypothetical protein
MEKNDANRAKASHSSFLKMLKELLKADENTPLERQGPVTR